MPPSKGHCTFRSEVIDRLGESRQWRLARGTVLLPRVFGFCRGVTRALEMLEAALDDPSAAGKRFFLLGPIIHNPWVNLHFQERGVRILSRPQMQEVAAIVGPRDVAVIPTFGATPAVVEQLGRIGCRVIDTTCPDVRRLWDWACRAAGEGYGVLIYGRADHDETVVTRGRLESAGGRYAVVGDLEETRRFCAMISAGDDARSPAEAFGPGASNAASLRPFARLAQVSQTTMLYEETVQVRELLRQAYEGRFGTAGAGERLLLQPTVCRATQDRQTAARELCQAGCDLIVVVGGFGSSNTRHLYELARRRGIAYFIEDASAILGAEAIRTFDTRPGPPRQDSPGAEGDSPRAGSAREAAESNTPDADRTARAPGSIREVRGWLPAGRHLRIGVLAGASSPEVVVGAVLQRLADLLSA